jgi:hypothetical protein
MPRLTASKEVVQGGAPVPEGMYTVRCDGFKPKKSKDGGSVNLNPQLRIINSAEYNDRVIFENLNTKAPWIWPDFHHCFGITISKDGNDSYEFVGFGPESEDDPEKWVYQGPILGQTGQIYVIQSEYQGKTNNKIKFYVCKMAGQCKEKHSQNLAKS